MFLRLLRQSPLVVGMLLFVSSASAQVLSSAGENDLHPSYEDDGWASGMPRFDVVGPGGLLDSAYLEPPDGNTYAGGRQAGGEVPVLSRAISGTRPGTDYLIEFVMMADRVAADGTEAAWFEVQFCSDERSTLRVPFSMRRRWQAHALTMRADADVCTLRFAAHNETGNGSNAVFIDSVSVAEVRAGDLAIAVLGPTMPLVGAAPVEIAVENKGSAVSRPVVRYPLPDGVTVPGGAGPVPTTGAEGSAWDCVAEAGSVLCTRLDDLGPGMSSTFTIELDFSVSSGGVARSVLTVEPVRSEGFVDPNAGNDTAEFVTPGSNCGNGAVEPAEDCDDGNDASGDGCESCRVEPGWECPPGAACLPV